MEAEGAVAWHAALHFALTGERRPGLGRQTAPDLDEVVAMVGPGPHAVRVVPADLMSGIGPARFAAVLVELRSRLAASRPHPVVADRTPDPEERRLLADVPPHH